MVAISPYESHLDARLYGGDAAAFNPGRQGMQLGGTSAVHAAVPGVGGVPGLAFGGGKYRCAPACCCCHCLQGTQPCTAQEVHALTLGSQTTDRCPACPLLCRCPGRAFAEAELALIASLLLLLYDWQLLPRSGAAGKQQQGAAAGTDGAAAAPAFPGDPHGLLPPPDLTKLVGIKVPAEPCFVQFQRRGLAG